MTVMLNCCSTPPCPQPVRYRKNLYPTYKMIYIVSTIKLEEQYVDVQKKQPELWQAFLSRIDEVRVFRDREKIDIYNSVDEYLNRDA